MLQRFGQSYGSSGSQIVVTQAAAGYKQMNTLELNLHYVSGIYNPHHSYSCQNGLRPKHSYVYCGLHTYIHVQIGNLSILNLVLSTFSLPSTSLM